MNKCQGYVELSLAIATRMIGHLVSNTVCSPDGVGLVFVVFILLNVKMVLKGNSIVRVIKHHAIKMLAYGGSMGSRGDVTPLILDISPHIEISGEFRAPFSSCTRKGPQNFV